MASHHAPGQHRRRRSGPRAGSPAAERSVLIAAGGGPDDAGLWTELLRLAHDESGGDAGTTGASGTSGTSGTAVGPLVDAPATPVAWAVDDVDTAVAQLRALLGAGVERALIVPFVASDDAQRVAWTRHLAREIEGLRARFPDARLDDLGAVGAQEADVVPSLLDSAQGVDDVLVGNALGRAFGGDPATLARFVAALREGLPADAAIVLRGSAVMGASFKGGDPFDAGGPGTSDLDIVVVGEDASRLWVPEARVLGGMNTLPLSDDAPWVAPSVDPARRAAQAVVGRPTAVQAMAGWFLSLRAVVQGQAYVVLSGPT